ncbi:MAG: hypothetical protein ACREMQ_06145 [Longimicrobiales bacterium]
MFEVSSAGLAATASTAARTYVDAARRLLDRAASAEDNQAKTGVLLRR